MSAASASYRLGLVMDVLDDAGEPLDVATLRRRTKLTRIALVTTLIVARARGLVARERASSRVASRRS